MWKEAPGLNSDWLSRPSVTRLQFLGRPHGFAVHLLICDGRHYPSRENMEGALCIGIDKNWSPKLRTIKIRVIHRLGCSDRKRRRYIRNIRLVGQLEYVSIRSSSLDGY